MLPSFCHYFLSFALFTFCLPTNPENAENTEFKEDTLNLTTPASIAYPAAAGVTLCSQTLSSLSQALSLLTTVEIPLRL